MRFIIIQNKEFSKLMVDFLNKNLYHFVYSGTGGDDDYICIDTLNKEYCWCEWGDSVFNQININKYQDKGKELRLSHLIKMR
jgi:hypothetical protein